MQMNSNNNSTFFRLACRLPPCQLPTIDSRIPVYRVLLGLLLAALVHIAMPVNASYADTRRLNASEYQIKAAYLYNFLLFTSWPIPMDGEETGPGSDTVIIGIVGEDPFGTFFNEVEGRTVKIGAVNKKLIIRRFGPYSDTADLTSCRLLFISASEKFQMNRILAKISRSPVLTVGDIDNFLESGGMVKLVKVKGKIRWEINRRPVALAELRLDSMLLKSAVRVIGNTR